MKKIIGSLLALISSVAFSATLVPVQLLNPAGSSAGQAIVSTGASTAPVWGNVTAAALAAQAANTVVANATGSSASPTAFAMPSCSASNSALQWSSGNGFICGTTFAKTGNPLSQFAATTSAQLLGVISDETGSGALVFGTAPTISNPVVTGGSINNTSVGVTTAAAGVFTTLAATGNDALLYTSSNALSVPNATVVTVTTWTKTFDRLNTNFNASTGVFTAPVTGYYLVSAQVVYSAAANVVSAQFIVAAQVAGVSVAGAGGNNYTLATGTGQVSVNFSSVVFATQGQAITIVTTQNTASTRTLSSANLSITRIP